jgi:putative FmdB family regulatory protein
MLPLYPKNEARTSKDAAMPLYEYECQACHRRLEKIQKFSDAELTVCPYCGGRLERTITAAAFSFAGGGWYKDGYGSTKPAAASSESATAAASSDATPASTSSDTSKPAAAPAPAAAPSTPAKP